MTEKHLDDVTFIHLNSLKEDFITSLGEYFVKNIYYKHILTSGLGFGFVCEIDNKVAGFIVGSCDSKKLHNTRVQKYWPQIGLCLLLKLISNPVILLRVLQVVYYMTAKHSEYEAQAELISLAVHPEFRRKGAANLLVQEFKRHLTVLGVNKCWTKTHSVIAKKIYENAGFLKISSFKLNGRENFLFACDLG